MNGQENQDPIIIDNGTGWVKSGLASNLKPECVFPNVIGTQMENNQNQIESKPYIGYEALKRRNQLNLTCPIEFSQITNFDEMNLLWEFIFDSNLIKPENKLIHLTESAANSNSNREEILERFFEDFLVGGCYISISAVLALFASGRTTGCVIDMGDSTIESISVFEGFGYRNSANKSDIGGRVLTSYLSDILCESDIALTSFSEIDVCNHIKETETYIALEYEEELLEFRADFTDKSKSVYYELPDGSRINFGNQQIKCPEVLFKPNLIEKFNIAGIQHLVTDTIQKSEDFLTRPQYENIVMAGGTSLFKNMQERLQKEIHYLSNFDLRPKITAPENRKFSAWIGASILSQLSNFQDMWITHKEYKEFGVNILHSKCF